MRLLIMAALLALTCSAGTIAALSSKPQGAEVSFIRSIQQDLQRRFPTTGSARRAGYFRYTYEDDTGAISYVNLHWTSTDPQYPSQLWYDAHGNLLGADFSRPYTPKPPSLWGVDPRRWIHINLHIHWVVNQKGVESYGAAGVKKFKVAGGNTNNPGAATVVKLGKATSLRQVTHIFPFPNIWDLQVWVKSNPNGAFAEKNPLVIPSKNAFIFSGERLFASLLHHRKQTS